MITIAEILSTIVTESPFLEEGIAEGLINLSALARKVRPQVEKKLMRPVSDSAIIMALKRMTPKITRSMTLKESTLCQLGDLTVRSDLMEYTFRRSETLIENQLKLLQVVKERADDPFLTITQGVYEITVILNSGLEADVEDIFKGERVISREAVLSAITLRLSPKSVYTPGVHYAILKQLAWHNINVVEVVSTYTEFTIILGKDQVDTSFSVLMKFLSGKDRDKC